MHAVPSLSLLFGAALFSATSAQQQQIAQDTAPAPVILTTTKSAVLPVLPPGFTGVRTLEGAIVDKGPANASFIGLGGLAPVQSNMPSATYVATLPSVMYNPATGATISGSITGKRAENGTGVTFSVSFSGFPAPSQYGPFVYHIHNVPVPADGNCTSTLAHFDPTNRGEYTPCNAANPASCQAGDLAGKHGKINATSFSASYAELYLSTDPSSPYFFGSKSIVIHTGNTTRLTCANFQLVNGGSSTGGMNGTTSTTTTGPYTGGSSTSMPTQVVAGSAGRMQVGVAIAGVLVAGIATLFL